MKFITINNINYMLLIYMKYDHIHSVEQLGLLLQYISIATIILGLPSVGLYIKKDARFSMVVILYIVFVIFLVLLYNIGYKTMFPDITIT